MKNRTSLLLSALGVLCITVVAITLSLVDCSKEQPEHPIDGEENQMPPVVVDNVLTVIADQAFLDYCISQMGSWDVDGDGKLAPAEAAEVDVVNVSGKGIASLAGIEYFTGLTALNCFNNALTELDISKNTALGNLDCRLNKLTALDVSKNTALTIMRCDRNQIASLDVSALVALKALYCSNNRLASLDVSALPALTILDCGTNSLTELTMSENNAVMTELECSSNELTALDVSFLTALTYFNCYSNQLSSLDISALAALTNLSCQGNKLTALDISANKLLKVLICYGNPGHDGTFVVTAWFDAASKPASFPRDGWELDGHTIALNYRKKA